MGLMFALREDKNGHKVTGAGHVKIPISSRVIKTVSTVLYKPDIIKNLLSVDSLPDKNGTLMFKST